MTKPETLPACAGMIPPDDTEFIAVDNAPCMCGDDPMDALMTAITDERSLHVRG